MTGLDARSCVPELLDHLDPTDPRAQASRRDLLRVNAIMLQQRTMAGLLRRHLQAPPRTVLEIGAGDGRFMLGVARRVARHWPGTRIVLLDRQDLVSSATRDDFARLGWHAESVTCDVFAWMAEADAQQFDVVAANLFLHHFDEPEILRLMRAISGISSTFVATEPRRNLAGLAASRMLWGIGANEVTRHDAAASVRAGFAGEELSALWERRRGDVVEERRAGLFTHAFAVSRAAGRAR